MIRLLVVCKTVGHGRIHCRRCPSTVGKREIGETVQGRGREAHGVWSTHCRRSRLHPGLLIKGECTRSSSSIVSEVSIFQCRHWLCGVGERVIRWEHDGHKVRDIVEVGKLLRELKCRRHILSRRILLDRGGCREIGVGWGCRPGLRCSRIWRRGHPPWGCSLTMNFAVGATVASVYYMAIV